MIWVAVGGYGFIVLVAVLFIVNVWVTYTKGKR